MDKYYEHVSDSLLFQLNKSRSYTKKKKKKNHEFFLPFRTFK